MLPVEWFATVPQQIINIAQSGDAASCPIALGVFDVMYKLNGQPYHYNRNYVVVGFNTIFVKLEDEDEVAYENMPSLRQWIIAFESNRKLVKPIVVGFLNEGNGYPTAYVKEELA
jgi:hypothetical protein